MDYKAVKIITENTPSFFWNMYYSLPTSVKVSYIKKFLKKEISKKDIMEFISYRYYYSKIEEYKKSEHYKIIKYALELDLEKYNWLISSRNKLTEKELDRDIKIWQIQRS